MSRALLVAATDAELCGHAGLVCGVGPVESALTTGVALERERPDVVIHVGIAGARRGVGHEVGSVVVGDRSVYEDRLGDGLAPRVVIADPALVARAAEALRAEPIAIGTSARVGGVGECTVEAMEGFSVLRACALVGVPAVEVRAISNHVDDARADWRIDAALSALAKAIPRLLDVA